MDLKQARKLLVRIVFRMVSNIQRRYHASLRRLGLPRSLEEVQQGPRPGVVERDLSPFYSLWFKEIIASIRANHPEWGPLLDCFVPADQAAP
jgi:hypothetical protein